MSTNKRSEDLRQTAEKEQGMRFIGIDVGSERHTVAIVDERGEPIQRPVSVTEDAAGYRQLLELLGGSADALVAMEATRHYWKNLFASLTAANFAIALLNPIRTRRFAEEELQRTKTDQVDALGIARFAAQKRPKPTQLASHVSQELRQLVYLRQQTIQHLGDRVRNLHRAIDLTFPEFTQYVRGLDTELATAILARYPSAHSLATASVPKLARLCFDGRRRVGFMLARQLITAAGQSIGSLQTTPFELEVRYACRDIGEMRQRARQLEADIECRIKADDLAKLFTTIQGVSTLTAAAVIGEAGDPSRFPNASTFASYVGVVPRLHQSGKRRFSTNGALPLGNARLRRALWMPVLVAIRVNPWLRAYYRRLREAGKRPKVAMIAAMHKLVIAIYSVAKHRRPFVARVEPAD
jgi:transposase